MTLIVGMPASLTGQFHVQGRQALAGLQAWARDATDNSSESFKVIYYDDASDRSVVQNVTRHLIVNDRVDILVGPYSSVLTSAAAVVAEEYCKLLWNQGGASDSIYQQGYSSIVGILTPANRYLIGLLPLVRKTNPLATTVTLVRASTGEFPKAVCSGIVGSSSELGFSIALETEFEGSAVDFTRILADIKASQADVVVIVGRIKNDVQLAREIAESNARVGAIVAVAAGIQGFQDSLGPLANGFIGPSQWEPGAALVPDFGPTSQEVVKSLRNSDYRNIDYPMAQAYAAGLIVQRCLMETESADTRSLREAAANLHFSTFYGDFHIDRETGRQIGRETLLVQWQEGQKIIVWPQESAQRSLIYPWA